MKFSYLFIITLLLGACAHQSKSPREQAQADAFRELREYQQQSRRTPSSVELARELAEVSSKLKTLKSYEYLVFPKMVDIAEKSNVGLVDSKAVSRMSDQERREFFDSLDNFGAPLTYAFSVQRNLSCASLKKEKSKFASDQFFADFKGDPSLNCLIVRGFQKEPDVKKGNIRKDDLLEVQLYFDEQLKPYGQVNSLASGKRVNFQTGSGIRSVGLKLSSEDHLSSGLFLLPIDYPNFKGARKDVNANWTKSKGALSIPEDRYVQAKIEKFVDRALCDQGHHTQYRTNYGQNVRIGWCKGDSLPTTIQTDTYFAVLKRISE